MQNDIAILIVHIKITENVGSSCFILFYYTLCIKVFDIQTAFVELQTLLNCLTLISVSVQCTDMTAKLHVFKDER